MEIRSVEDLQNNLKAVTDYCNEFDKPVFLTENGKGKYAIMSHKQYVKLQDKLELLNRRVIDLDYKLGLFNSVKDFTLDEICKRVLGINCDEENE